MNVHSVNACHRPTPPAPVRTPAAAGDKRDAILKAATRVFARNGFFQSQVADVARAAGVAAGTVYLYFRSKDDLLVSLFERTMREAIAEGRAALEGVGDPRERLSRIARLHLERLGRDRDLAVVFQVELRQSTKFMEQFSSTYLRDYLGLIRETIADGQKARAFRADINPTIAAKVFFGALDEMATNWMLSKRRYSLVAEADAVVDLFVGGVGRSSNRQISRSSDDDQLRCRPRRRHDGRADRAALRERRHPAVLLDLTPEVAAEGLEKARRLKPDPQFTPDAHRLVTTAGFDDGMALVGKADWIIEAIVERLDIKQQLLARVEAVRAPGSIVSSNTSGIPISRAGRGPQRRLSPALARHALLQPAALPAAARADSDRRNRSRRRRGHSRVCRPASGQGRGRREGHAELHRQPHRALRRRAHARSSRRAAATPSKRSTPSPVRPWAGPAARRSARWTSPASTSSRT